MVNKFKKISLVFFAIILILLTYQNCGNKFTSGDISSSSRSAGSCKLANGLVVSKKSVLIQKLIESQKINSIEHDIKIGDSISIKLNNRCTEADLQKLHAGFDFSLPPEKLDYFYVKATSLKNYELSELDTLLDATDCVFGFNDVIKDYETFSIPAVNDTLIAQQGHLLSSTENFTGGLKIKEVWDLIYSATDGVPKQGSTPLIKVAVLGSDSAGINFSNVHNDLITNSDLSKGLNYRNDENNPTSQRVLTYNTSTYAGYPEYYRGHEAHIAGLIAATPNNNLGVTGISPWRVSIISYQADSSTGYSNAIRQAVADGVDIITMSFGFNVIVQDMTAEIKSAVSKGVLVILAAGNNAGNLAAYPQRNVYDTPGAIVVGGTESQSGMLACFTTRGTGVELYAPATDSNLNCTGATEPEYLNFSNTQGLYSVGYSWNGVGSPVETYIRMAGTSMAAPVVAASAALIMSYYKFKNIPYTPAGIESLLLNQSDPVPGSTDYKSLNLLKTVTSFAAPPPPPPPVNNISINTTSPLNGSTHDTTESISFNASTQGSGIAKVVFYLNQVKVGEDTTSPYSLNLQNLNPANYKFKTEALDSASQVLSVSPEIQFTINSAAGSLPACN